MPAERVVAIGLLTQRDLEALGGAFRRQWPVNEAPCFEGLLQAIDEADRALHRERDEQLQASPAIPTSGRSVAR